MLSVGVRPLRMLNVATRTLTAAEDAESSVADEAESSVVEEAESSVVEEAESSVVEEAEERGRLETTGSRGFETGLV